MLTNKGPVSAPNGMPGFSSSRPPGWQVVCRTGAGVACWSHTFLSKVKP